MDDGIHRGWYLRVKLSRQCTHGFSLSSLFNFQCSKYQATTTQYNNKGGSSGTRIPNPMAKNGSLEFSWTWGAANSAACYLHPPHPPDPAPRLSTLSDHITRIYQTIRHTASEGGQKREATAPHGPDVCKLEPAAHCGHGTLVDERAYTHPDAVRDHLRPERVVDVRCCTNYRRRVADNAKNLLNLSHKVIPLFFFFFSSLFICKTVDVCSRLLLLLSYIYFRMCVGRQCCRRRRMSRKKRQGVV